MSKEQQKIRSRKHYLNNREVMRKRAKEFHDNNKEHVKLRTRKKRLKTVYGITIEQFDTMLISQNSCCALCDKPFDTTKKNPSIDHCHTSGKVRGILCQRCNILMGFVDTEGFDLLLEKAIKYKHGN